MILTRSRQILVGLFTAVALLAVASRIYIQIARRGRLFADDYLIIAASCSLIVETALWYHMSGLLWMVMFLAESPKNLVLFGRTELLAVFKFLNLNNVYLIFAWLTNYVVKLSFLAFFRVLVQGVNGGLKIYWWFVMAVTVASWLFNAIEVFAVCGTGSSSASQILFLQNALSLTDTLYSEMLPVSGTQLRDRRCEHWRRHLDRPAHCLNPDASVTKVSAAIQSEVSHPYLLEFECIYGGVRPCAFIRGHVSSQGRCSYLERHLDTYLAAFRKQRRCTDGRSYCLPDCLCQSRTGSWPTQDNQYNFSIQTLQRVMD
jgi:hypothetical protein